MLQVLKISHIMCNVYVYTKVMTCLAWENININNTSIFILEETLRNSDGAL